MSVQMDLAEYDRRVIAALVNAGVSRADAADIAADMTATNNPESDADSWLERQWLAEMERHHG